MKVYFSGSIKGGRQLVDTYNQLIGHISSYATVLTEHIGDQKYVSAPINSAKHVYEMDTDFIKECDIVIADITVPSLGVGYELAYAEKLGKPTYCIYDSSFEGKISYMIIGDDYFVCDSYGSVAEAKSIIDKIFVKGKNNG